MKHTKREGGEIGTMKWKLADAWEVAAFIFIKKD